MRILIIICCFLFGSITSFAQASWTVSSNAKSIPKNEPFTITYTLSNGSGSNYVEPKFKYFRKLNGPSLRQSTTNVNGRFSSSMSYVYTVVAEKTGTFPLPAAKINIKGKQVSTSNRVKVKVVKGKVKSASGKEKDPVLLNWSITDSNAVVGQPLDLELKIHSLRSDIDIKVLGNPNFDNFYREVNDSKTNRVFKETINGQVYFTKVLAHFTLYPLQEGRLNLDPYHLSVNMATANQPKRRSFFDMSPRYFETFTVATNPIAINVEPLPYPSPANFSGAVGTLDISCKVDRSILTTDEVVLLEMKIFGKGDTKQIQPPKMPSTDSLEIYPPKLKEERQEERNWGLEKVKIYEYTILPKYAGQYSFLPSLNYFDTDSLKYVDKSCGVINLRVSQGSNRRREVTKQPVIDDGLASFVESAGTASFPSPGLTGTGMWSMYGAAALAFFGILGFRAYRDNQPEIDQAELRRSAAQKVALAQLETANQFLSKSEVKPFYESLSSSLYGYVVDKLKVPHADLNQANIQSVLSENKVPEQHIATFTQLIKKSQLALYAGAGNTAGMQEAYNEARDLLVAMEEWLGL